MNSANRGKKRDQAAIQHQTEMEKIRQQKRMLRRRRMEEQLQRERTLIKLRHEYRKAKGAVMAGQCRISCTASSMSITIPQLVRANGQTADPFSLVFSCETAEQKGLNSNTSSTVPRAQNAAAASRPTDPRPNAIQTVHAASAAVVGVGANGARAAVIENADKNGTDLPLSAIPSILKCSRLPPPPKPPVLRGGGLMQTSKKKYLSDDTLSSDSDVHASTGTRRILSSENEE
ncbi:hypothetical protein niasHT_022019 [Heterodera trifolii]|uniref:Uncharacterized protein n=1 Tax=Heterodera trifolii TaxID=157864 RepID=A0ABD2IEG6_9BILA